MVIHLFCLALPFHCALGGRLLLVLPICLRFISFDLSFSVLTYTGCKSTSLHMMLCCQSNTLRWHSLLLWRHSIIGHKPWCQRYVAIVMSYLTIAHCYDDIAAKNNCSLLGWRSNGCYCAMGGICRHTHEETFCVKALILCRAAYRKRYINYRSSLLLQKGVQPDNTPRLGRCTVVHTTCVCYKNVETQFKFL